MKFILTLITGALLVIGCAKIPAGSVTLADAVQAEGSRMHTINMNLVNSIFNGKRTAIESFINNEYAPKVIGNFFERNPAVDKKDFPELIQSFTVRIVARRDSLMNALETEKLKLIDKLHTDYRVFNLAATELKLLLESATKVTKEREALFAQAKALSNNRVDFIGIESALDKFIHSAGNVAGNISTLSSDINQHLNK
jgi:PBP1b-binding outer membrane lipoprotein LpoB